MKDRKISAPETPKTFAELEARLLQAADSIDAGRGENMEEAFAYLRKRIKAAYRCSLNA